MILVTQCGFIDDDERFPCPEYSELSMAKTRVGNPPDAQPLQRPSLGGGTSGQMQWLRTPSPPLGVDLPLPAAVGVADSFGRPLHRGTGTPAPSHRPT